MGAEEAISEALRPAVQAAGLEIWDVERSGASVRVLVERDGGVDLDSISDVSRSISAVLDERDDLVPAGRYTLEVSSPGLERRLRYPRHFARYIGQERAAPLSALGEEDVCLPLISVERANAVFSWGAPAKAPRAARPAKRGSINPRTSPTDLGRDDRRPAVAAQEA
jgi:ribosome maturation factor RimP